MKQKTTLFHLILLATISACLAGSDNHHFYRASNLFDEPRFEKPWLTTGNLHLVKGSTRKGLNNTGHTRCLFDTWGFHNMQQLGANVPNLDPENPGDATLIALQSLPSRSCFGMLSLHAKAHITDCDISLIQNLDHGFFCQLQLPIRSIRVSEVSLNDRSPRDSTQPNAYTPTWQLFLQQLDTILARHDLHIAPYHHTGCGDTSLLIGWTKNNDTTEVLDYHDITITSGILAPTGRARSINNPLDIPLGYNKHVGLPIMLDTSIGLFEWLTLGLHAGALIFSARDTTAPLATSEEQSGLITLTRGQAQIKKGPLRDIGSFFKVDHAGQALSFILGYTYAHKTDDTITPANPTLFKPSIIHADERYKGWSMHTLHLKLEYDFSTYDKQIGPRVGLAYNHIMKGKRIFKTDTGGATIGIDVQWTL